MSNSSLISVCMSEICKNNFLNLCCMLWIHKRHWVSFSFKKNKQIRSYVCIWVGRPIYNDINTHIRVPYLYMLIYVQLYVHGCVCAGLSVCVYVYTDKYIYTNLKITSIPMYIEFNSINIVIYIYVEVYRCITHKFHIGNVHIHIYTYIPIYIYIKI